MSEHSTLELATLASSERSQAFVLKSCAEAARRPTLSSSHLYPSLKPRAPMLDSHWLMHLREPGSWAELGISRPASASSRRGPWPLGGRLMSCSWPARSRGPRANYGEAVTLYQVYRTSPAGEGRLKPSSRFSSVCPSRWSTLSKNPGAVPRFSQDLGKAISSGTCKM